MTEQKGKGYQGIGTIEVFEYKNTRSNVITEKNEKQYVRLQLLQLQLQTTWVDISIINI